MRVPVIHGVIARRHPYTYEMGLGHAVEDDSGVERSAFDRCMEFVLGGVEEVPAERDSAKVGVHENGAITVVPGNAEKAGLSGTVSFEALG